MTIMQTRSSALALAMLGLATPALAQDGLCGGTGANGQWIGGEEAASDIATADNYQEQMALLVGGNEYVALFSLSAPAEVRVEAEGRGAGDPIIDLIDSSGSVILSDDDSGGGGASRAETPLEAGTYCMAMRSYDGGPMTAFVRIGRTEHEPLTEGVTAGGSAGTQGSCDEAAPLGPLGSTVTASANETPFWSFTLDAPTPISITAQNEDADPVITLYAAEDEYIDENDDYDGLNSRLDVVDPLEPGTYCIGVAALSDDSLPITINLTEYDPEEALRSLYSRGDIAPPTDGSVQITDLGVVKGRERHDLQATGDVSWYSVEVEDYGLLVVEAVGATEGDPWLVLYDDLGRQVAQNDDYGDGLDSLVVGRVDLGTYYIGVKQFEGGSGAIRLLVESYVRAK